MINTKKLVMCLMALVLILSGCGETSDSINNENNGSTHNNANNSFYQEYTKFIKNKPENISNNIDNIKENISFIFDEVSGQLDKPIIKNDVAVIIAKIIGESVEFEVINNYEKLSLNKEEFKKIFPLKESYTVLLNKIQKINNNIEVITHITDLYINKINSNHQNIRNNVLYLYSYILNEINIAELPDENKLNQMIELLYNLNEKTKNITTYEVEYINFHINNIITDSEYNTIVAEYNKIINNEVVDEELYTDTDMVENMYYTGIAEKLSGAPSDYTLITNKVNNRVVDLLRAMEVNQAQMPSMSTALDKKETLTAILINYLDKNNITYNMFNVDIKTFEATIIDKIFSSISFGKDLVKEWNNAVNPPDIQDEPANNIENATINYYHTQLIQKIVDAPYFSTQKSKNRVAEFLERLSVSGATIPDMSAVDKHDLLINKTAEFLSSNNYTYTHFNVGKNEFDAGIIKELFETNKTKIDAFIIEWNKTVNNENPENTDEEANKGNSQVENYLPNYFLSELDNYPGTDKRTIRSENRALLFFQTMKTNGANEPDYSELLIQGHEKYVNHVTAFLKSNNITYDNFNTSAEEFTSNVLNVLFTNPANDETSKFIEDWNKLVNGESIDGGETGNKIAPNESSLPQAPAEDDDYYDTNISTLYWYTDPVFDIIKGDTNYTKRAYNRVEDLIQAIHTNAGNLPDNTNANTLSSSLMQVLGNQLKAWGFTYKHLDLSKEDFKQYVIDVIFVNNKAESKKLINEWNKVK